MQIMKADYTVLTCCCYSQKNQKWEVFSVHVHNWRKSKKYVKHGHAKGREMGQPTCKDKQPAMPYITENS